MSGKADSLLADLLAHVEKASAELARIESDAAFKAAQAKHKADPTQLSADERSLMAEYRSAKSHHTALEVQKCALQLAIDNSKKVEDAVAGGLPAVAADDRPKLRGHDETWLKDGHVRAASREQWNFIQAHHSFYLRLQGAKSQEEVKQITNEALKVCDRQAFIILTAFAEGWNVALKLMMPGYIQSEEEHKQVQAAKRLQSLEDGKVKPNKSSKPYQGASPATQPVAQQIWGQAAANQAAPYGYGVAGTPPAKGACFTCGQFGHWSRDCPNRGK